MVERLLHAAVSSLVVFGWMLLPTVAGCILLSVLAAWQRRLLLRHFGWKSLLLTGWLGTPIHELSHAAAGLLFGHKISEMRLFKPNPVTGQLGYVKHTYNPRNPYAAILGNAMIPIAPLFGGALAILLLTLLLVPDFLPRTDTPATSASAINDRAPQPSDPQAVSRDNSRDLRQFWQTITSVNTWTRWQFYVYLYVVFCIAMHLSPSRQDFQNFAKPAVILSLAIVVLIFLILLVGGFSDGVPSFFRRPLETINGLLAFAIGVSVAGAALFTAVVWLFRWIRR